jgi:hypothetical protein
MTWAALDRKAAAAPATPGYGVEDQDHPAHTQDDPGSAPYMIGGPSEFAEDVHQPPYGDSGAPATPGYGVEDQDHPAHQGQVGRKANLMGLVRKKAAKALKLAQATLGKKGDWAAVEDQALAYMSMDEDALDASLERLSGGFLAEEEPVAEEPVMAVEDPILGADSAVMARLKAMEDELQALKLSARRANQNDPKGPTLGTSGKSEEEEKKEEAAASNKSARAKLARLFTTCDLDNDGFVTEEDWIGSPEAFSELDLDGDGIIAKHEVLAGEVPEAFKKQWDKGDEKKDDEEKSEKKDDAKESGKKAAKKAEDEKPKDKKTEGKKSGKKAAEDEEPKDEKTEGKKAFGHLAEFTADELEMLQAMQYGEDEIGDEGPTACEMAAKKAEDESGGEGEESEDGEDKEASFFETGFDPLGLSDGTILTAADKAAFDEVFGKQADDEGEAEAEEGEKEEKEANRRLASLLKPQPRKPSQGVQRVGTQSRTASSGKNEVAELSSLWTSDPDVSGSFS